MDAKHFDAWTRRRFGLAAGSAVAALVAFRHTDDVAGKRRCKKLNRECDPNGKRCCGKLECAFTIVEGRSDFYCCKPDGATCTLHASCCSTNCLGTCQSCRGWECSAANRCCPAEPCINGFCGGCADLGESCNPTTHPCCPASGVDCESNGVAAICGGCKRWKDGFGTPSCGGTDQFPCCDTECNNGLCASQQDGPCVFDEDCLSCVESDYDPEQCAGACDPTTHTCTV